MKVKNLRNFLTQKKIGIVLSLLLILMGGLAVVLIGAILVLVWRKITKTPYFKLGLFSPKNWLKTVLLGVLWGVLIKLTFSTIVMPLMGYTTGTHGTFDFLKGNLQNAILFSFYVILIGGFCEELVFRGFLFFYYEKYIGTTALHKVIMVVGSSLIFGIPHFYQGGLGVVQSMLVGMIFGSIYLINKKNIWMVMIAHAVFDLVAIFIVYKDMSNDFNNLFFS